VFNVVLSLIDILRVGTAGYNPSTNDGDPFCHGGQLDLHQFRPACGDQLAGTVNVNLVFARTKLKINEFSEKHVPKWL
jgi:hypothetical protein